MQVVQGSLVIIGANKKQPQVLWNGIPVNGIIGLKVNFNGKVVLKINKQNMVDDAVISLVSAGVKVKEV